ncbi:MAG: hypothetical protein H6739_14260 [Alphaproteobacteria bacterium]|nr:hypothetical protein [Alphaproteobacteria bacterium]
MPLLLLLATACRPAQEPSPTCGGDQGLWFGQLYSHPDARSASGVGEQPPILLVHNAHGHTYGFTRSAYVEHLESGTWAQAKEATYQGHRREILWLASEAERYGARLSFQLNGEYARDARLSGDDHLAALAERGHTFGAHFHPSALGAWDDGPSDPEADGFWARFSGEDVTADLITATWESHLTEIEAALGAPVHRVDDATPLDDPLVRNQALRLMDAYDVTLFASGEEMVDTPWAQLPLTPFRPNRPDTLTWDPTAPWVALPSHPQIGRTQTSGEHLVLSTPAQLKRRFLQLWLERLYARAVDAPALPWSFGTMTHPDTNALYREDVTELYAWLGGISQQCDPWGEVGLEPVTDATLLDRFEDWEDAHPDAVTLDLDDGAPYPYGLEGLALALVDTEYVAPLPELLDAGAWAWQLARRGAERTQDADGPQLAVGALGGPLWVLWAPEPVTIDLSPWLSGPALAHDGLTGEIVPVDPSALRVDVVPRVIEAADAPIDALAPIPGSE